MANEPLDELDPPWEPLKQGGAELEAELRREVGPKHSLWGKKVTAIARRYDNDDVLFRIEGRKPSYAVVHLTWVKTGECDPGYPDTRVYRSYKAWTRKCMDRDFQELEGRFG